MNIHYAYSHCCSLLPGNQILIRKYLARRGVVVSGGGAMDPDGNKLQNSCCPRLWGHNYYLLLSAWWCALCELSCNLFLSKSVVSPLTPLYTVLVAGYLLVKNWLPGTRIQYTACTSVCIVQAQRRYDNIMCMTLEFKLTPLGHQKSSDVAIFVFVRLQNRNCTGI